MNVQQLINALYELPRDREIALGGSGNIVLLTGLSEAVSLIEKDDLDYEWLEYPDCGEDEDDAEVYVLLTYE